MSEYVRAEYTPLFTQVQDIIAESLNSDPQLSSLGITFYPEHNLEIEYEIKKNLGQQGIVGIVNTLKGFYGGHNGNTNAWEIEAEIDVVENPTIRRAQMKKMGLSAGSTADIIDWVQESLCGPSSPSYGKFCAQQQQLGEDSGLIVGKSIVKTFAIADVSAIVSGEHMWHCPYALASDLEDLSGLVYDMDVKVEWLDAAVKELSAEISGGGGQIWEVVGELSSDVSVLSVQMDNKADLSSLNNYLPLNLTKPTEISGNVYLDFNCLARFQRQTVMNGALDVPQLNIVNYDVDSYTSLSAIDEDTIGFVGGFNREYTALLNLKNDTIAYTSDIPSKTSELTNDSGFLTSAQVIPSQINVGNASMSDKSLASQSLTNDVTNEHSMRVVVDEYDNVILQKYTTGWYVSKIERVSGTISSPVYTETNEYFAYVSDVRFEQSEGRIYYTVDCQDKQRNLKPKHEEKWLLVDYSPDEFINGVVWQGDGGTANVSIRLTIKNSQTPVWVNVARLVPDTSKFSGLLDTQIAPNGQFITPKQIEPYSYMPGAAKKAQGSIYLWGRSSTYTIDANHFITLDTNNDYKAVYVETSQYPWQLSMYDGTTFDPPLELTYHSYVERLSYKENSSRLKFININSGCWWARHDIDNKNSYVYYIKSVENENGQIVPDNNFNRNTNAYPITFSSNNLSIETIDGVAGGITCTRQSTNTVIVEQKYLAYENDISAKADLSAVELLMTQKQDALSSDQLSSINSVVDERSTTVKYRDNTTQSFYVEGYIDQTNIPNITDAVEVKIGTGVTTIGTGLFNNCQYLTKVTIPNTVTGIYEDVFKSCYALTSIDIPDSVSSIDNLFGYTGVSASIVFGSGITSIPQGMFHYVYPPSVTFRGKTLAQVQAMTDYPWDIEDTSIIKTYNVASQEWTEQNYLPLSGDTTADVKTNTLTADAVKTGNPNTSGTIGPDAEGFHYEGTLIDEGVIDLQTSLATATILWRGVKIDAYGTITVKEKDGTDDVVTYDVLILPKTKTGSDQTIATQEWVLEQLSTLQARIAALENQ